MWQPEEARAAGRGPLCVLSHLKVVEIRLDKGLCQLERAKVDVAVSALGLQSNLDRGWDSGQAAVLTGNDMRQRNLDISIVPQQLADRVFRRVARDALDHNCGIRRVQSTLPAAVTAVAAVAVIAVAVAVAAVAAVAVAVASVAVATFAVAAKAAAAPVRLIIISGSALSRARAAPTPLGLALRPVEVLETA